MAEVQLRGVTKRYGDVPAVQDVDLTIDDGELMVLVGPSGCGKSTTLRMIAGLESITSGELLIDGRVVNDVAPRARNIAMVFQSYALYPHMTVFENMAFGLKIQKLPRDEIRRRVDAAAQMLGITELLGRKPKAMSGGQRQRVAMGRAIVRQPAVFLFDEPLSNLDAKLRVQMRVEISRLHRELAATMVYVTHDQVEAMTLADRIAIMEAGWLRQAGTPMEVYHQPANKFVAGFIGSPAMNFIDGALEAVAEGIAFVAPGLHVPLTPRQTDQVAAHVGAPVSLGVRPHHLTHRGDDALAPAPAVAHGAVEHVELMGSEGFAHVRLDGGQPVVARLSGADPTRLGDRVTLVLDVAQLHLFSQDAAGDNLLRGCIDLPRAHRADAPTAEVLT